jgi:dihydroorotate dehydrogenase
LSFEALDEILELVAPRNIAGIVATNTTISRPQTDDAALQKIYAETGGLSGKPLARAQHGNHPPHLQADQRQIAHHRRRRNFQRGRRVGKNHGGRVARAIYTGLVYEGPASPKKLSPACAKNWNKPGMKNLPAAVGSAN